MNTRILDLIKNPELLQIEDLKLLEPEIEKMPYMQSLRAIYLLGVHQFYHKQFQTELTKTAAYTTDKKILYHLINKNKNQQNTVLATEKNEEKSSLSYYEQKNISTDELNSENHDIKEPKNIENSSPSVKGIDFYTKNLEVKNSNSTPKQKTNSIDFYATSNHQASEEYKHVSPISFYEKPLTQIEEAEISIPKTELEEEVTEEQTTNTANEWKPMQLDIFPTAPSQYIVKTSEKEIKFSQPKEEILSEPINEKLSNNNTTTKKDSNVSSFINTWQNWLKIDRTTLVSEQEKKAAIIDKFIENSPKISPIKEDVEFVVKEKSDDISHLMTETLAQLYVEQKLYSKAIKAYQILQEKYPEKNYEFQQKIEEIKKSRTGK